MGGIAGGEERGPVGVLDHARPELGSILGSLILTLSELGSHWIMTKSRITWSDIF